MRATRGRLSTKPLATALVATALATALATSGCGFIEPAADQAAATSEPTSPEATTPAVPSPTPSAPQATTPPAVTSTTVPAPTTTAAPTTPGPTTKPTTKPSPTTKPTPTVKPTPTEGDTLHPGDSGAYVRSVQRRLSDLGYWLGTPDGSYGYLTTQAVMALQKAAGLGRDGVFGPATRQALQSGVRPQSRVGGTGIEIDKVRQILLVVRGGRVTTVLNTSTGNGELFESYGQQRRAVTPAGSYRVFRSVNGNDEGPLGDLWRPRYFNGGIAVHGAASVPAYPASHGCARVSNAAMDMLWAQNHMPIGGHVTVY